MKNLIFVATIMLIVGCDSQSYEEVKSSPRLERESYMSDATGQERDYYVYLPEGFDQQDEWPLILFLHGNGERGDGKEELDYTFIHGPIFEAWPNKRKLPFVILVPQLPIFTMDRYDWISGRTLDIVPYPMENELNSYRPNYTGDELMGGVAADSLMPYPKVGQAEGWPVIEKELLSMLDHVLKTYKGDEKRVYLTGLSTGGFGVWYMGSTYPERFAAMAPITAFGHPDLAGTLAKSRMPIWVITGGRDPYVDMKYFYPALNKLEALGHPEVRFTVHEDMGHIAWQRAYAGEDLYNWFLQYSLKDRVD
jgi:predicted peptidase